MCDIGGKKTLLEKEKLLVTSNFSFSRHVFHRYISLVRQNAALCGNWLNLCIVLKKKRVLQLKDLTKIKLSGRLTDFLLHRYGKQVNF